MPTRTTRVGIKLLDIGTSALKDFGFKYLLLEAHKKHATKNEFMIIGIKWLVCKSEKYPSPCMSFTAQKNNLFQEWKIILIHYVKVFLYVFPLGLKTLPDIYKFQNSWKYLKVKSYFCNIFGGNMYKKIYKCFFHCISRWLTTKYKISLF